MGLFGGLGGGAIERVGVDLVAKTGKFFAQVDGAVNRAEGKFGGMAKKVGKAVALGAAAGGVALAGLGAAAVKMGLDFEHSIAEVKTLLPDLSEEGFNALKGDVLDLSKEMGIATSDMIPALYQAISAGVPPENVIDFLRTGAKASIGGVTDLATAVDGLTTVQNAFGYSADQTGRIADVMFTGVKLGKTTMAELSQAMFQAAPLAASLGLEIEDVVAATATLTKSGTPTSVAMTQIRQAMVALTKPTADMAPLIEATGYESGKALLEAEGFAGALQLLTDASGGNTDAMAELQAGTAELNKAYAAGAITEEEYTAKLAEMTEASGVNTEVLGKAFGSVEALQAVLGLTGENAEVAAADLAAMNDATGAADEAFETMSDTLKFKINKAINTVKVEMTKFGVKVLPLVAAGLEWLVEVVGDLADFISEELVPVLKEWWKEHGPGIVGTLEDIGDVLDSTLLPALETLGEVLSEKVLPAIKDVFNFLRDNKEILAAVGIAIMTVLVPGIVAWTAATVANTAAHIALAIAQLAAYAPIIAIIAVIALLVYGIIMLVKHWDEVVAFITDTVIPMFEGLWTKIDEFLSNLPLIGEAWEAVKNVVEDKINAVIGIVQGVIDVGKEVISFFKNVFKGDWDAAWTDLKQIAEGVLNLFLDFLDVTLFGTIKSILESIVPWDWVKEKFNDFETKAGEVVGAVVGFFEELPGKITGFLTDVGTAAWNLGAEIPKQIGKGIDVFKGWLTGPINAIITAFEKGINWIGGAVNDFINFVATGGILGVAARAVGIPMWEFKPIPTINIGRLAAGGPLAAGEWAQVNERGLEFFRPFSSGVVMPTAPTGAGAGGSRWTNYGRVNYIYGPGRRTDDVLRDLDRLVR